MSWFESVSLKSTMPDGAKPVFDPQLTAMTQLGAMSPLWLMFMGASTAGMAYWGMTRWMRQATPEKIAENVVKLRLVKPALVAAPPAPEPEIAVPEPVAEALEVIEAVMEAAPEPVLAATPEPVAELIEAVTEAVLEPIAIFEAEPVVAAPIVAKVEAPVVAPAPIKTAPAIAAPAPVKTVKAKAAKPPAAPKATVKVESIAAPVTAPVVSAPVTIAAKPKVAAKRPGTRRSVARKIAKSKTKS